MADGLQWTSWRSLWVVSVFNGRITTILFTSAYAHADVYVKHVSHSRVAQSQPACHVRKSMSQLELNLTKETKESLEVDLILVSPVPGHQPALQMSDWTVDNSSRTKDRHTCICSGHWVTQLQPGLTNWLTDGKFQLLCREPTRPEGEKASRKGNNAVTYTTSRLSSSTGTNICVNEHVRCSDGRTATAVA